MQAGALGVLALITNVLLVWLALLGAGVRRFPSIGTSPCVRAELLSITAATVIVTGTPTLIEALR